MENLNMNIDQKEAEAIFDQSFKQLGLTPETMLVSCDPYGVPVHYLSPLPIKVETK